MQADVAHMQGTHQITAAQSYAVHEIQAPSGIVVREYLSPAGKVFAVAWQGPWPPDLKQLLGSYFDEYQQAQTSISKSRPGRAPISLRQSNLVVQHAGHMRSFSGRAYLTDQLPAGVTAESIR